MIFDQDSASPALALFCARQLAYMQAGGTGTQVGVNISEESGMGVTTREFISTASRPRWVYVENESFGVALILGTDNMFQAANIVSAWSLRIPNDTTPGLPQYFNDQAFAMRQLMGGVQSRNAQRVYFVGHSLGGALAEAMAVQEYNSRFRASVLSTTFGSPRVGDIRFRDALARNSNTRWMNDADPVPLLPPEVPDSIQFAAGLGIEVIDRWSRFLHGGGGIVLDDQGRTTAQVIPPLGLVRGGASLAAFLLKAATDQSSIHSLTYYVDRLQMLVANTTPPQRARVVESPIEPTHNTHRGSANAAIDQWRDTIVHTGAQQNASALTVPDDRQFRTVKFDGFWWVTFGGALVAVGPTRKRAGAMATRGNEFLRRLQRMAGVDINALKFLFPIYLDAASTPNNGFKPVIAPIATS